jgi:hypothetical protein
MAVLKYRHRSENCSKCLLAVSGESDMARLALSGLSQSDGANSTVPRQCFLSYALPSLGHSRIKNP